MLEKGEAEQPDRVTFRKGFASRRVRYFLHEGEGLKIPEYTIHLQSFIP